MFNKKSRTENTFKTSLVGVVGQLVSVVLSFAYRTVFLMVLNESYLGINGLFTNVLTILSLADLGIGASIVFRLYNAVKLEDINKSAALMSFYKNVYRVMALIVTAIGLAISPAIKFLIKDFDTLSVNLNVYLVYFLFLAQSVTSYFFSYKQSIMMADQKAYSLTICSIITNVMRNILQIAILFLTKDFVFTLATGIIVQLLSNFIISLWVTHKYKPIFKNNSKLTKDEKKAIYKESLALLCHKVGGTVSLSIDSILLSSLIGSAVLGIYSNYTLIVLAITGFICQLLGTMASSVGNLHFDNDVEKEKRTYFNLLFANIWIVGFCAIALFTLLNPFIETWLRKEMTFSWDVVLVICISFYLSNSKIINGVFINACGLFTRDKIRPFIESIINLTVSILLIKFYGIIGVFIGTITGVVCTVWWREPYLLFKHEFKSSMKKYFAYWFVGFAIVIFSGALTYVACLFIPNSWGYLVLKLLICLTLPNLLFIFFTFKTKEFKYYFALLGRIIMKIKNKLRPNKGEKEID